MSARIHEIHGAAGPPAEALQRLDRGARTPAVFGFQGDPALVLRSLILVIVGLGSIGSRLADLAARVGVRALLFVDPGRTKPESLLTHPLAPADVGRSKAVLAGERAKALSPETRVLVFDGSFQELPWDALVGASFVLLASDNLACEVSVALRCLQLGLPLVHAAVYGRGLVAQVRILAHRDPAGPCAVCQFTGKEWEDLDRNTVFSCADAGRRGSPAHGTGPATVSPPELCALAANLAFVETRKAVLGLGPAEDAALIEYSGLPSTLTRSPLRRSHDCPLEHARTAFVRPASPLASMRLGELLREASGGGRVDLDRLSLSVDRRIFTRRALCECDAHPALGRFVTPGDAPPPCVTCGAPLHPHPFATDHEVSGMWLEQHVDRTLAELGLQEPCPAILVRGRLERTDCAAVLLAGAPPLLEGGDS